MTYMILSRDIELSSLCPSKQRKAWDYKVLILFLLNTQVQQGIRMKDFSKCVYRIQRRKPNSLSVERLQALRSKRTFLRRNF